MKNRRGSILLLVAVTMVALMSLLALAVDGGILQREKRLAQTAADAGAMSAAIELYRTRPDSITASALSEAKKNGFENGVGGDIVTVTYPAVGGQFSGSKFVNVVVVRQVTSRFATWFGVGTSTIRARATAGLVLAESCFILLDPSSSHALELNNSASLTGSGCGLQVYSTSATGAYASGNASVVAPEIGVAGTGVGGSLSSFNPTPNYNTPPAPNPMAYLAMPAIPNTCNYGSAAAPASFSGTVTLNPGTYCGGLTVNGTFSMNAGLYIFRGGGLNVTGGGNTLRSLGTGVTIINTAPPAGASYGWGGINVQSGSVTIDLSANTNPASALPGVLFYADPASPFLVNLFKANAVSRMDGTMYFPTQKVQFESGATFTINGALIAYQAQLSQSVNITFTGYGGGADLLALRRAAIVD